MSKINISKLSIENVVKQATKMFSSYGPEIITGLGVGGLLTSICMAVNATPKATKLIDVKKEELKADRLTTIEIVKTCAKCYAPTVLLAAVSTSCIVGATAYNYKRNATLLAMYKMSENTLSTYKEAVNESEAKSEIEKKIAQKTIDKNHNEIDAIDTGNGDTLFMEPYSGREFYSSKTAVDLATAKVGNCLCRQDYVSYNDWCYIVGLPKINFGDMMGWINREDLEIRYFPGENENGELCYVMSFNIKPVV